LNLPLPDEEDFKKAWYDAAVKRLTSKNPKDQFDPQHLANIFYGYALLKQEVPQTLLDPIFNILRVTKDIKFQHSIYRGLSYYHRLDWLDAVLQIKYQKFCNKKKEEVPTKSNLQKSISSILSSIFPEVFQEEVWFDALISHVDFYSPQCHLVIEVDGPSHFLENTQTYSAKTLLRNLILEESSEPAVRIVSIPYYKWASLRSPEAKKSYLQEEVEKYDALGAKAKCNKSPTPFRKGIDQDGEEKLSRKQNPCLPWREIRVVY
jgi:hypothetical protein